MNQQSKVTHEEALAAVKELRNRQYRRENPGTVEQIQEANHNLDPVAGLYYWRGQYDRVISLGHILAERVAAVAAERDRAEAHLETTLGLLAEVEAQRDRLEAWLGESESYRGKLEEMIRQNVASMEGFMDALDKTLDAPGGES